jgi:putative flippase GtrA
MRRRIIPFALAGTIGFAVDAAVLLAVTPLTGPFAGRVVSFLAAVASTWLLNRNFAFADRRARQHRHREFARYALAMLPGATLNWLSFSALVLALSADTPLPLTVSVGVGSLVGLAVNLVAANWLVFRGHR